MAEHNHKPYRKPSIRVVDGNGGLSKRVTVTSTNYVHYNDGPMPAFQPQGGCPPGYESFYQVTSQPTYTSYVQPPVPKRSNSYHEHHGALQVQLLPCDGMYRRASESSMFADPSHQYLDVPGIHTAHVAPQMSRSSTTRPFSDSLSDVRQFAQHLQHEPDVDVKTESNLVESSSGIDRHMILNEQASLVHDDHGGETYGAFNFSTAPQYGITYDHVPTFSASGSPSSMSGPLQGWQPQQSLQL